MIIGTRKQFIELENGDIQFSVVVPAADRNRLFDLVARSPGDELVIASPPTVRQQQKQLAAIAEAVPAAAQAVAEIAAKPPTQTVAPQGGSFGAVASGTKSKQQKEAQALCDNPRFQQFAREMAKSDADDDLRHAQAFLRARVFDGAVWDSDSPRKYEELLVWYAKWGREKGYGRG